MYAKNLKIYGFKCFGKAELNLQYPSSRRGTLRLKNVNVILGDNGGGKSSILRALAIAILAPILNESGFVPYRLVRRSPQQDYGASALVKVEGSATGFDRPTNMAGTRKKWELLARLERVGDGNRDRLHLEHTPYSPFVELLFDDTSPAYFVVGYGATRRVETGDFSESSARRSRGLRYRRIAGLFEDHVTLRPLRSWFFELQRRQRKRFPEAVDLINKVLPQAVVLTGDFDIEDGEPIFLFNGNPTPFSALSDGYKSFIGWIVDLVGHLVDVAPDDTSIDRIPGIVLVDEIDLHLHPEWQRSVIPTIANAFPRIQFIFTTHSPLVAATVESDNVYVTELGDDGSTGVRQPSERLFGRGPEDILLSSYFGLESTRPDALVEERDLLFLQAAKGDARAALRYVDQLISGPPPVDMDSPNERSKLK
ncbi:AAA family ATPase [Stenotrophomonas maltophilia]|nr:AAA family ATPase [Stenotrophomonas maltophilia]